MDPTQKPEDGLDIIHPEHGQARCRRDQLEEFRGCGWKPASEANDAETKAAKAAAAKAAPEAAKARAVVNQNRAAAAEAKAAGKKK